jgi:hypothetical protein
MAFIKNKNNCDKDVEKEEPLHTVGGNANKYNHFGEHHEGSSKN